MKDYTNQDVQKQILVDYMHLMIVLEEWDALTPAPAIFENT